MNARAIVDSLVGAPQVLARLTRAVAENIAANADLSQGIVAAGVQQQAPPQQAQAPPPPPQQAQQAPPDNADTVACGSLPTDGQAYIVRPGFCFPDNRTCHGSILKILNSSIMESSTQDIFKRDSLFKNFANSMPRDLDTMIDVTNAAFKIDPEVIQNANGANVEDFNTFNYRRFFFTDSTDEALVKYNRMGPRSNLNMVRLRYDVGQSYTRQSANLSVAATNDMDVAETTEMQAGRILVTGFKRNVSWTICPAFFTFRMLPLKEGYMTAFEYSKSKAQKRTMDKCIGVLHPSNTHVNDVYLYTFVDRRGQFVTYTTQINKKIRNQSNSFQAGDLPYEDDFFIFPTGVDVVVCARFPDGILLFNYSGKLTPIPPFGTIVKADKLHRGARERPGYPDQDTHVAVSNSLNNALNTLLGANRAGFDALTISLNGANPELNRVPVIQSVIVGAVGYIAMMSAIKQIVSSAVLENFGGGYKYMPRGSRRHRHYKHKSIKRNKSKSKSKGRGRARAASMLKSAKQRYYKTGGMGLGLLQSAPQPLQTESPLIAQASPI
jgi:hypothetical protein